MSNPNPPSGGPPLRALAMVLIALAIVFAGLGAMSLSSSESTASETSTQGQATQGQPTSTTTSKPAATTTSAAESTTTTTTAASSTTTSAVTTTAAADKAVPVRVLNNSTVAGLAARTAGQLTAEGWTVAETGNYPGGVIPKTTVYYGNSPGEQAAAQQIAEELGVTAEPRFAGLASSPPGVIVIVTGN
ncbi:LytR C-terminal domain-containing protein [Nocardia blacklockiae]|uniref:LytR C-terminal domain-containing protein n=1 Tax=Nocardia blacklockiae TaxID=480036 RepID=UPI00189401AE|nr:LytR C-terminal domain-containing protein [Nocardia blacklockiae]MBF6175393.1 LytR C-terminal domain-containing protein [Nocardia blacklockiae]